MRTTTAILLLLAALAACTAGPKSMGTKMRLAKSTIAQIESAANQFYALNGSYPESLEMLVIPDSAGAKFLAHDAVPKDPWGEAFVLEVDGDELLIWTYGADGQAGGEGRNRDFNNRMIADQEV